MGFSWGAPYYKFSRRVEALTWAKLKSFAAPSGSLGLLTGRLIPDALITERRVLTPAKESHYQSSWEVTPKNLDELAETTIAVELQQGDTQTGAPLLHKVIVGRQRSKHSKLQARCSG